MFDACPVHPKGTMVIPMLWRISEYVVCMMGVKNQNHHTHPYGRTGSGTTVTVVSTETSIALSSHLCASQH